jgi:diacylglycerol kinase family enzyme
MSEWLPVEQLLEQEHVPYVTAMTDHKKHAVTLAREAASQGYRRIAAVGGDGSLHEVLGGICSWCAETGTPTEEFYLAVVPIGSGNDWIKSCRVPNEVNAVLRMIFDESFGWMDVLRAESRDGKVSYVANSAGVGFDSHVCERVNRQKEQGMRDRMIYLKALRYTIFHLKPVRVVVREDETAVFAGEAYSIAIGNGPYSGGGMRQVPLATNDDGLIDYMIVPKTKLLKLVREVPRLFAGTVHESPIVVTGRCPKLRISPLDEASADIIEFDGEIEGQLPLDLAFTGSRIHVLKGMKI